MMTNTACYHFFCSAVKCLKIAKKKIGEIKLVVSGAGASAQSCLVYISLGVKKENIYVFDSKGLIHESRRI